ncbi:unnamed protein product, partial [Allacma fusca]
QVFIQPGMGGLYGARSAAISPGVVNINPQEHQDPPVAQGNLETHKPVIE